MFYETKFLRGTELLITELTPETQVKLKIWFQRTAYIQQSSTLSQLLLQPPTQLHVLFTKIIEQMPSFLNFLWIEKNNLSHIGYQINCMDVKSWNDTIELPNFKIRITIPLTCSCNFLMKQSDYDEQNKIDAYILNLITKITPEINKKLNMQIFIDK